MTFLKTACCFRSCSLLLVWPLSIWAFFGNVTRRPSASSCEPCCQRPYGNSSSAGTKQPSQQFLRKEGGQRFPRIPFFTSPPSPHASSQAFDIADHPRPHFLIRQAPIGGPHIVDHMLGTAGGGRDRGYAGMGNHELEEKLGPGVGVKLGGPVGQGLAPHQFPQAGAAEGGIDQHRHAQDRKSTRLNSSHV